jgi:hypothetical protein
MITCPGCGEQKLVPHAWRKRNKNAYCSNSCRARMVTAPLLAKNAHKGRAGWTEASLISYRAKMMGSNNPAWKGGATYRKRHGNYVTVRYVRCPPEFQSMARADGYVMEHRLVMARWIARPLSRTECVHHLNHLPLENNQTNLELWPDNKSHKLMEHGRIAEGAANRWCPKD